MARASNRSNTNAKKDLQMCPGHRVHGLDVSGDSVPDSVPQRDLSVQVQHLDDAKEIRVPNNGHRTTTTCDPVNSECSHSLVFVHGTGGKGRHHFSLRLIITFAHFAQLCMIVKVARGAGSTVTSYRLRTPGRNQSLVK
jgi:hypothetical protein